MSPNFASNIAPEIIKKPLVSRSFQGGSKLIRLNWLNIRSHGVHKVRFKFKSEIKLSPQITNSVMFREESSIFKVNASSTDNILYSWLKTSTTSRFWNLKFCSVSDWLYREKKQRNTWCVIKIIVFRKDFCK